MNAGSSTARIVRCSEANRIVRFINGEHCINIGQLFGAGDGQTDSEPSSECQRIECIVRYSEDGRNRARYNEERCIRIGPLLGARNGVNPERNVCDDGLRESFCIQNF